MVARWRCPSRTNLRIHLALPLLLEERGEREARVAALELDTQLLLGHSLEVLSAAGWGVLMDAQVGA